MSAVLPFRDAERYLAEAAQRIFLQQVFLDLTEWYVDNAIAGEHGDVSPFGDSSGRVSERLLVN